ncbi:hypothetical protein KJ972_00200 [Candidatus Micrarchaeota archaeon]|nr:hypothetical protein [Candidatus Micrarchaeota archaeon]
MKKIVAVVVLVLVITIFGIAFQLSGEPGVSTVDNENTEITGTGFLPLVGNPVAIFFGVIGIFVILLLFVGKLWI